MRHGRAWGDLEAAAVDRESGAAEIARRAAEALAALPANDVEAAVLTLVREHPAMAPLWRLGSEVLEAADHTAAARGAAERIAGEARSVAAAAGGLVSGPVVTHSYSSTLVEAVARAGGPASCATSEPGGEGTRTARLLRAAGVAAETIDDAPALDEARWRTVVVGADAIGPSGVVNKVGTKALVSTAAAAGAPRYVLAGNTKFLASDLPAPHPFERTPLELFTAVLTEDGPLSPEQAAARAARFRLHPALQQQLDELA